MRRPTGRARLCAAQRRLCPAHARARRSRGAGAPQRASQFADSRARCLHSLPRLAAAHTKTQTPRSARKLVGGCRVVVLRELLVVVLARRRRRQAGRAGPHLLGAPSASSHLHFRALPLCLRATANALANQRQDHRTLVLANNFTYNIATPAHSNKIRPPPPRAHQDQPAAAPNSPANRF